MRRINPYPPAAASEIERCIEIGQRVREQARQRAAARLEAWKERDRWLAQEYLQRKPTTRLTASALKAAIGAEHHLRRTAAIDAINRGLKLLTKRNSEPR